jgi:hypothetical protein
MFVAQRAVASPAGADALSDAVVDDAVPSPRSDTAELAPEQPLAPASPARDARVWYGWQTLLVDALAAPLGVVGGLMTQRGSAQETGAVLFCVGAGLYVLGPPVVHFAHAKVGIGFADIGVRLVAPLVGTLAGSLVGAVVGQGDYRGTTAGAGAGVVVGLIGASLVDAMVLAYDVTPAVSSGRSPERDATRNGRRLTPEPMRRIVFSPFGLAGTF